VAALAELALAHGGTPGLVAEALVALTVLGFFVAVYLRERRSGEDEPAELRDDEPGVDA